LGYESWNLYGISYGTRLALTEMRDFPNGIRSVMLDSTYPLESDLYSAMPANLNRALSKLFADCEAHSGCSSIYPNLEEAFYGSVYDLNENPQLIGEFGSESSPLLFLSGDVLMELIFQAFYVTELLPKLPELIYSAYLGDYGPLQQLVDYFLDAEGSLSQGVYLSVQCGEEVPFSDEATVEKQLRDFPDISGAFRSEATSIFDSCEAWAVPPAEAIENEPVTSDIPTLVMAGSYDPITPPEWGSSVAIALINKHFYELPGVGHGVIPSSDCAEMIAKAFLGDPSADPTLDCLAALTPPDFTS
jgi:pimeloyl-ACP methyl ester carboxylesterase